SPASRRGPSLPEGEADGHHRRRGARGGGQGRRGRRFRSRAPRPALSALRGSRAAAGRRGAPRPALALLLPAEPPDLRAIRRVGFFVDARPGRGGWRVSQGPPTARARPPPLPPPPT